MMYKVKHFRGEFIKVIRFDGTYECYEAIVKFLTGEKEDIKLTYVNKCNHNVHGIRVHCKNDIYQHYFIEPDYYVGLNAKNQIIERKKSQIKNEYIKIEGDLNE